MISYLRGTIGFIGPKVVVDVNGVGYGLEVSELEQQQLADGQEAELYVYEHIQERSYDLYGFTSMESRQLFQLLVAVSGVGPKAALAILNLGPLNNIKQAIAQGNTAYISGAAGVGRRTAERVVVEVKDKLTDEILARQATGETDGQAPATSQQEAQAALIALGYSQTQAWQALQRVNPESTTEEQVKQALREIE